MNVRGTLGQPARRNAQAPASSTLRRQSQLVVRFIKQLVFSHRPNSLAYSVLVSRMGFFATSWDCPQIQKGPQGEETLGQFV